MDLGNNWAWDSKKLPCKIRPESGNPAIDELRQRLSDLTGVPIPDAPAKQMKARYVAHNELVVGHALQQKCHPPIF